MPHFLHDYDSFITVLNAELLLSLESVNMFLQEFMKDVTTAPAYTVAGAGVNDHPAANWTKFGDNSTLYTGLIISQICQKSSTFLANLPLSTNAPERAGTMRSNRACIQRQ